MPRKRPSETEDAEAERLAVAALERRPRTEAELRRTLAARGFSAARVDAVVGRLRRAGFLDDRALAVQYLLSRSERLGHAPARLAAELRARGVPAATLAEAEREAKELHGLDPASALRQALERRGVGPGADPTRIRRVYNALLRAGHSAHDVQAALSALGASAGEADDAPTPRRGRWRAAEDETEP